MASAALCPAFFASVTIADGSYTAAAQSPMIETVTKPELKMVRRRYSPTKMRRSGLIRGLGTLRNWEHPIRLYVSRVLPPVYFAAGTKGINQVYRSYGEGGGTAEVAGSTVGSKVVSRVGSASRTHANATMCSKIRCT